LHWFDVEKFSSMVDDELLAEDGVFAVTGYFCDGFDYNFPEDQEFSLSG